MRLAAFILAHMDAILAEWDDFASTRMPAAKRMTSLALRDHAEEILRAVAKDLSTSQTTHAQREKSLGRRGHLEGAPETAAQTHAVHRARSGFEINQLVAEYRALRASVLRLWAEASSPGEYDLEDVMRFNEAIDQAVAESVAFFTAELERARNLILGMLGHDMRVPLQTILLTAGTLGALTAGKPLAEASSRLMRSGARIQALLNDLVDFNRTNLGLGIHVTPAPLDLGSTFSDEVDLLRAAYPDRPIHLEVKGDTSGHWDGARLRQVLCNLVTNAIEHGDKDSAVRVIVTGRDDELSIEVINKNTQNQIAGNIIIFEPLVHGSLQSKGYPSHSLGIGLYIAREIAKAHGGEINLCSDEADTTFAVRLPREVPISA
jgi:signal transduction histidine kinase